MTEINVVYNNDGYMWIEAKGHTKSNVCTAVSVALQSNVRFLQELANQFPKELKVKVIEKEGNK